MDLLSKFTKVICCFSLQKIQILSFSDKQQKEKSEWERIEASVNDKVADVRTKQTTWLPTEGATHDRDGVSHNGGSSNVFGHESSAYDLEQREMEIIADLERSEEAGRRITSYHGNGDDLDGFSSRSVEGFSDSTAAGIEARVTLDMQTTVSKTHPRRPSPTGRKTLDLDEERRRMERWDAEQEEKRKVGARGCMLGCVRCWGEILHRLGDVCLLSINQLGQLLLLRT